MLGKDECTWGPTHWCSDKKVAKKCGVEQHCQNKRLGVYKVQVEDSPLIGANECTWGPRHWCSSPAVAKKCNKESYCNRRRGRRDLDETPADLVGAKECTWGPGYWCASAENAAECGTTHFCSENGLGAFEKKFEPEEPPMYAPEEPLLGADEQ